VILIGVGANLPSSRGSPRETCEAALGELERREVAIARKSRWYESAPIPLSDQPWFVNGVVAVVTALSPHALLTLLHDIERAFGRVRGAPNAARTLDLDLLAYHDTVLVEPGGLTLPHPRMMDRAFVLLPLAEIAPEWRHPVAKATAAELAARLPNTWECRPIASTST
jgi:2-amino-4-hydroxy-6-hydroxymethyldihydropteridine diphosphokinase